MLRKEANNLPQEGDRQSKKAIANLIVPAVQVAGYIFQEV
jgi:hypothetical protein